MTGEAIDKGFGLIHVFDLVGVHKGGFGEFNKSAEGVGGVFFFGYVLNLCLKKFFYI